MVGLSKTSYCTGLQCPKILWLDLHNSKEENVSQTNQARINTGIKVGEVARGYFGRYSLVPYNNDIRVRLTETERLLSAKTSVICEAFFATDDGFCSVDILRRYKDGYEIVEVKSSTSLKHQYLDDMAFQYHILKGSGLNVKRISLMHINNKYERLGELDLKKLFAIIDCTKEVKEKQNELSANIKKIKKVIASKTEPNILTGKHCDRPYPCPYIDYCYGNDIKEISSVNQEPQINKTEIKAFLKTLNYPLYYLDFETFQEAIPSFDHQCPYQQIPCQYSLHIQLEEGAELVHREFLAEGGTDPRRSIAEKLCADIPKNVCVLAYYMSFEKRCISGLAALFPDLASHLMAINENMKDLIVPFKNHAWHSEAQEGSNSIKAVLPAMFPNDPELNYDNLHLIRNGNDAMDAFANLPNNSPEEQGIIRAALLAYCRLDTLAMVRILEKLRKVIR